ncbi:TIGR03086 family metal-binding protein [Pseudonocardia spinosispora]|uniref:TIGR03086 family metal-binding protein n=1 Tax=Pseudonocardia spinosispora TaxID=103441 RepID=UPI00055E71DB|nr:TIGR03086 family metal-binding protein [Pseudonocardia spinosispora]
MPTIDLRPLHRLSLDLTTAVVDKVGQDDLTRDTPCAGWDLAALLGHMIGQNHGFADAAQHERDAPLGAFAPQPPGADLAAEWRVSADRTADAFASADLDRAVLLPEVSLEHRLPIGMIIGFHLIDTVAHGWDVATALDLPYRPTGDLLNASLKIAEQVPTGHSREQPNSSFAPVIPSTDTDPWLRTLTLLGRRPTPRDHV